MIVSVVPVGAVLNLDPNPRGMILRYAPLLAPQRWSSGAMWIARRCVSTIVFLPLFLNPPLKPWGRWRGFFLLI